jgi:hypothetical protein
MIALDRARWLSLEPLLDQALELSVAELEPWLTALETTAPDDARDLRHLMSLDRVAESERFLAHEAPTASLVGRTVGAYALEQVDFFLEALMRNLRQVSPAVPVSTLRTTSGSPCSSRRRNWAVGYPRSTGSPSWERC